MSLNDNSAFFDENNDDGGADFTFGDDDHEILTHQNLPCSALFQNDDEKSISNLAEPVASSTAQKQKIAMEDSLISLNSSIKEDDKQDQEKDLISFIDDEQQSLMSNFSVDPEILVKSSEPSWKKTFLGEEFSRREIGDKDEFFKAEEVETAKNHPFIEGADISRLMKNCDTSAWSLGPDDSRVSDVVSRTAYFGAGSEPLGSPQFEKTLLEISRNNASNQGNETLVDSRIDFDEIRRLIDKIPNSENVSVLVETILKAKNELEERKRTKKPVLKSVENGEKIEEKTSKIEILPKTTENGKDPRKNGKDPRKNEILRKSTKIEQFPMRNEISQKSTKIEEFSIGKENSTKNTDFAAENNNPETTTTPAPHSSLFTNKRLLSFGCTELLEKSLQHFSLKNNSQTEILRFKLILHQKRSCEDENFEKDGGNFQILNSEADGYVLLHPKETLQFKILFKPREVKFYNAKILISTVNHPQRLCIPIFGYGGSCNLVLQNFKPTKKAFYDVTFDLKRRKQRILQLHNKGSLAGFFRVLLYRDSNCSTFFDEEHIQVYPARGVIPSGQSMDVTVTVGENTNLPILGNAFAHMVVCFGEEISRQRLKKWENEKNRKFLIKERSFTQEKFVNEENNGEKLYDPEDPQQAVVREEAQLFLGHLREIHCRLSPSPELYNNDDSSTGSSFFPIPLDNSHCFSRIFFKKPQTPPPERRCSSSLSSTVGRHFSSLTDIVNSPKMMHSSYNESGGSISVAPKMIQFVDTNMNARDTVRIEFRNNSTDSSHTIFLNIDNQQGAFTVNCPQYRLDPKKLVRIAVHFEPKMPNMEFSSILQVKTSNGQSIDIPLRGKSLM